VESIVSGRNCCNTIFDQTGTAMVIALQVPDAVLQVVVALSVTLPVLIAPLSVRLFAGVTA